MTKCTRREFVTAAAAAVTLGPGALSASLVSPEEKPPCPDHWPSKYPKFCQEIWRDQKLIKWEQIAAEDTLLVAVSRYGRMRKIESWEVDGVLTGPEVRKYNHHSIRDSPVLAIGSISKHYEYKTEEKAHFAQINCILEMSNTAYGIHGLDVIATVGDPSPLTGVPSGEFMKVPNLATMEYFKRTRGVLAMPWDYFTEKGYIEPEALHRDWPEEFAKLKKHLDNS